MSPPRKQSNSEAGDSQDGRCHVGRPDRLLARLKKFQTNDPAAVATVATVEVKKKKAAA